MTEPLSAEISYLLSLQAVRERSQLVLQAAKAGSLNSFEYHEPRMSDVAKCVIDTIKRDYGPDRFSEIPPHGRWQQFNVGGIDRIGSLLEQWASEGHDKLEQTRRLIDLFFMSVLVDAGVGDKWQFKEPNTGNIYSRSEGTAVASLYMFKSRIFSLHGDKSDSVDALSLKNLTEETFNEHFQITPENPMVGVASRVKLLNSVGESILKYNTTGVLFKGARVGTIVDHLINNAKEPNTLDYQDLWSVLQGVLIPSWGENRTRIAGNPIGDAWPLQVLADRAQKEGNDSETAAIAPFHKLTQWLGYSLTVPFTRLLGIKVINDNLGTGLPEYRNGGLFYDLGALKLKPEVLKAGQQASGQDLPLYPATGDTIVEWRAMTVALLDELHKLVSEHFEKEGVKLSLAQMLEAGSWLGGRELAAKLRPNTKSSPILFEGDGTLF